MIGHVIIIGVEDTLHRLAAQANGPFDVGGVQILDLAILGTFSMIQTVLTEKAIPTSVQRQQDLDTDGGQLKV